MKLRPVAGLAVLTALALPAAPALAQADSFSGGAMFLRAFIGLVVVVALILACAWVARRFGIAARVGGGMPVKLVGSMALGPRDRIVMLEVDDTWLVVGVTPGGMSTLHTLPARALPETAAARPDFLGTLQQAMKYPARRKPDAAADDGNPIPRP